MHWNKVSRGHQKKKGFPLKIRLLFLFIFLVKFIVLTFLPNSIAQVLSQKHLPEGAMARIGKGSATDVKYSPDGTLIAVASQIGIWIYDADTYQEIDLLTEHSESVEGVAFSPDGQTLAGANRGGTVKLWDVDTGHLKATFTGSGSWLWNVAFSPDGQTLACADGDELKLWDVATQRLKAILKGHTSLITSVAFSPDGQTLASGSWDSTVRLWDAHTGELERTLTGHADEVESVAYSPDGRTLASGSWDSTVRLWDAHTGQHKATLEEVIGRSSGVVFSPDGQTLAGGYWSGVSLWDAHTGQHKATLGGPWDWHSGVAFSPDGQTLASSYDSMVKLWDVNTGQHKTDLTGHAGISPNIAFSPDGQTLASTDYATVRLWDADTGQHITNLIGHTNKISSVAFSPNPRTLASGSWGEIRLWDVDTQQPNPNLNLGPNEIGWKYWQVLFSADGRTLAAGSQDEVQLWDVDTGHQKTILRDADLNGSLIAYSPNGRTLATRSTENTIRLWDTFTVEPLKELIGHTGYPRNFAFSPDGSTLVSGSWGELLLWDVVSGQQRGSFQVKGRCNASGLAFSPDGSILVTEWNGTDVALWNVATREQLTTFAGHGDQHQHQITSLAFNPNGNIIASSSVDGTVLLWRHTPTTAPLTFIPNTVADQTFEVGTPVNVTLPIAMGGTPPYTYSLLPLLDGLAFDVATRVLYGTPTIPTSSTLVTYTATDTAGQTASLTFTIEVTGTGGLDVNGDGQVSVIDLAIVALFYGTRVPVGVNLPADVNADGVVDLLDLTAVAQGIDAAGGGVNQLSLREVELALLIAAEQLVELEAVAGAPMGFGNPHQHVLTRDIASRNIATAFADARLTREFPAGLSELLQLLAEMVSIPETTMLLPNYPNPFNPETWIPYHLSDATEVVLTIYDISGPMVRQLALGHQPAGVYRSRGRAAYWDGKNQIGEKVASGLYFYTLTAGDFTATRKLLIRK